MRICEAEQRSKLLMTLLRMGLLTKDVKHFMSKQLKQQRSLGPKGGGAKLFKSGKSRMMEKLSDSRKDDAKLRKVRDSLRIELEEMVSENVYQRLMKKLKMKVQRIRLDIKAKNRNKITGYKEEKDREDLEELSSLQDEMGEFGQLKIFQGISIQPEERKPPVSNNDISLSKYEKKNLLCIVLRNMYSFCHKVDS